MFVSFAFSSLECSMSSVICCVVEKGHFLRFPRKRWASLRRWTVTRLATVNFFL